MTSYPLLAPSLYKDPTEEDADSDHWLRALIELSVASWATFGLSSCVKKCCLSGVCRRRGTSKACMNQHRSRRQCHGLPEQTKRAIRLYIQIRTRKIKESDVALAVYERKLITVAQQVEKKHVVKFDDMCKKLTIREGEVHKTFLGVIEELFCTGINWGRIGAFFSFGGALAHSCLEKGISGYSDKIVSWMYNYAEKNLIEWMDNNGGWDGFNNRFTSKNESPFVPQLRTGGWFSPATLAVGMGMGALGLLVLTSK
eukprot:m.105955 g.105955  ORF g.105955 m.105955 type:complete len:256 (+) comp37240_c0_seq2:625-1392(+)